MQFLHRLTDTLKGSRHQFDELKTVAQCQAALEQEFAIFFKHSFACELSLAAYEEVSDFCRTHENAPVYMVSVLDSPEASQFLAEQTKVVHQSPQVIGVRKGQVVGSASHRRVNGATLEKLSGENL